jgi:hypothetical protein
MLCNNGGQMRLNEFAMPLTLHKKDPTQVNHNPFLDLSMERVT